MFPDKCSRALGKALEDINVSVSGKSKIADRFDLWACV
jgi:hypothetical protein